MAGGGGMLGEPLPAVGGVVVFAGLLLATGVAGVLPAEAVRGSGSACSESEAAQEKEEATAKERRGVPSGVVSGGGGVLPREPSTVPWTAVAFGALRARLLAGSGAGAGSRAHFSRLQW